MGGGASKVPARAEAEKPAEYKPAQDSSETGEITALSKEVERLTLELAETKAKAAESSNEADRFLEIENKIFSKYACKKPFWQLF